MPKIEEEPALVGNDGVLSSDYILLIIWVLVLTFIPSIDRDSGFACAKPNGNNSLFFHQHALKPEPVANSFIGNRFPFAIYTESKHNFSSGKI